MPNPKVHRNIRIENNVFHLRGQSAVGAKSTSGLRVTGNRIHAGKPLKDQAWLQTSDCEDVIIEGNRVAE